MMVFTSIYGVVDGYFVSNYAGKTQFAAINLILPFVMMVAAVGFMFGTGGSALVSKTLGEGDKKKANSLFSLIVYFTFGVGVALSIIAELALKRVALSLGADGEMLSFCVLYGRISFISMPFFMLQNVFQSFFVTAEKPNLGLYVTVAAGVTNMLLDFILVGLLHYGTAGAAAATAISEFIGGGVPLFYFFSKNKSTLRLGRADFDGRALIKSSTNGASEFFSNISMSLVNMVYNYQLIKYFGQDGIAAFGVIMYVNFMFLSIGIGYSVGVAPIVGFNYGAENYNEQKNIFKKSVYFYIVSGVAMLGVSLLLAGTVAKIFTGYDEGLCELTKRAFALFATSYLLAGFNIFASAYFTALNNGGASAVISVMRTFVFQIIAVLLLPVIFGIDSIWLSRTVGEVLSFAVAFGFLAALRKKYKYI